VGDYRLSRQFLEELAASEKSASARDFQSLEEAMAAIVQNSQSAWTRAELLRPFLAEPPLPLRKSSHPLPRNGIRCRRIPEPVLAKGVASPPKRANSLSQCRKSSLKCWVIQRRD
jgi:hypothetical protein